MPDDARLPAARPNNQDLQTMDFADALDAYTPNLADALPDHIPLQRFKRVVVTAVNMTPDLRRADRRSLFNACVKCAHDGLYPDGREAALVVFSTKEKRKNERGLDVEVWVPKVQYLPMIAGIRKRMRNTGELLSATAEVVYRNDRFRYVKGEDPRIEHEPCALDQERGDPVGAYAIIRLANGEVLREVMGYHEIQRARAFSKTGDKKGSPWETSWGEMARKTVLRRCAKSAPTGSDLDRLLARDDEEPESAATAIPIPPRPQRSQYIDHVPDDDPATSEGAAESEAPETPDYSSDEIAEDPPSWTVIFPEGEVREFDSLAGAEETLSALLNASHSKDALEAIWEDNRALVADSPHLKSFDQLVRILRERLTPAPEPAQQPESAPSPNPPLAQTRRPAPTAAARTPSPSPEGPTIAREGPDVPRQATPAGAGPPKRTKIPVPVRKDGSKDYRLWAQVPFMSAARKADPDELPFLIGDHEGEIAAYKAAYPIEAERFQKSIDALFG